MASTLFGVVFVLILSLGNFQPALSSGYVEVVLSRYLLKDSAGGSCCSCPYELCDPYFLLCLTYNRGPHCIRDEVKRSRIFEDQPAIDFNDQSKFIIQLPQRTFSIKVKIWDDDFLFDNFIDDVQVYIENMKPTENGMSGNYSLYSLEGKKSILVIKVRSYCEVGYFGENCNCRHIEHDGRTCEEDECDQHKYSLTLDGQIDTTNFHELRNGLLKLLQELGDIPGILSVDLTTTIHEIRPGVKVTNVTFCCSGRDGPVGVSVIKAIFESHTDDQINTYLPFNIFTFNHEEEDLMTPDDDNDDVSLVSLYWYVIVIIFFVIFVIVAGVVVFCIIRRKQRQRSEEDFWRCHSVQNRKNVYNKGFDNHLYCLNQSTSCSGGRPASFVSSIDSMGSSSENHYEDLENVLNQTEPKSSV